MSTRFFASIRRNQRQWMVVVTVLSMVSFLFLDDFGGRKGPMSSFGGAMIIGCLCAAGMCIVGYPRQKTMEYGISGFIVGAVAGFVGFGSMGINKPIVRTAVGNFSRSDFDELANHRQKLNHFVSLIASKVQNGQAMGFGGLDDESLVTYRMLLADARKMGIQVTDERVNEYLKQLGRGRLSREDYKTCLREAKVGEGELFEYLKSELSAQLVIQLTEAPGYVPPIPPQLAPYLNQMNESPRYMQETPQQLWGTFQKLTVKVSLEVAAIPVRDFVSKVTDPSEQDVNSFFEKYKFIGWTDEADPGFQQMQRVQLAYLTGDFEKFEKGSDPTDTEVQEYYEKNKDKYRAPLAKESTAPKLPDEGDASKPAAPVEGAEKPDDATKPKQPEAKTDPAPEGEKTKPADEEEKEAKPEAEPKSNCGDDDPAAEKPAADKPAADKPAAAAANADEPKPAEPKPADGKAEVKTDAPPAAVKGDDFANGKPGEKEGAGDASVPKLRNSPESLPAPKYRDLNDELKLEIRDVLLKERTFVRIAAELDKADDFMINLGLEYAELTDAAKKKEMAKSIAEKMKVYAHDHNLEYKETSELAYQELTEEPIGNASDVKSKSVVANEVFMPGPQGEPRMGLYSPRRADQRSLNGAFAYWKIADLPAQVANPQDAAVHARVVSAWKFNQARSLAEQRAKELAAKVKSDADSMPAALSGESVTGVKTDPAITIIPTDPFAWLSVNQSVPGGSRGPTISAIPLIPNIDNGFMQVVFGDLNEGETGVAVDRPRAIYYVVKVISRDLAKDDDGGVAKREHHERFMHEEFSSRLFPIIKTPYQSMAAIPQQVIDNTWRRNFQQQHHVTWEENVMPVRSRR